MSDRGYQLEYARDNAAMHSAEGRQRKAATMLAILREAIGSRLTHADVLNLGCSTGIIDEFLASHVGTMTGVDIDAPAVALAESRRKGTNIAFRTDDAMGLSFAEASFDVVICSQVYEHVPDSARMMAEIERVLRPGGVCYFAATNRWGVMEQHHHLPFLSWVPRNVANLYVRMLGQGDAYYEQHLGHGALLHLASNFRIQDWTERVIAQPETYAAAYMFPGRLRRLMARVMYASLRPLFPGFIWLLWKPERQTIRATVAPDNPSRSER